MSDGQKQGVVITVKRRQRRFAKVRSLHPGNFTPKFRKIIAAISSLLLIIVVACGVIIYGRGWDSDANQCNGRQDSQIYHQVSNVLNPGAIESLGVIVERIEKMNNFKSDPTCLYVSIIYDLSTGNADKSRKHYKILKGFPDDRKIIQLGPDPIKSLEQLDFEITLKENQFTVEYQNIKKFSESLSE